LAQIHGSISLYSTILSLYMLFEREGSRLAISFELWAAILASPARLQQLDRQRQIDRSTSVMTQFSNWLAGQIALIVGLTPIADRESRIVLQIYPAGGSTQLPAPTRLRLLAIDGDEIAQASATVTETIQLQFRVSAGERFQVEIECGGSVWIERFEL
jgi:hypothetical protein